MKFFPMRHLLSALLVLVVVLLLAVPEIASAQESNWVTDIMVRFLGFLLDVAKFIFMLVLKILMVVINAGQFMGVPGIQTGWKLLRDLSNMLFIIVMLAIAFGTILRIESYKWQRLLPKLIFAAIMVNFSKTIALIIIDVGQVIMFSFVSALKDVVVDNFVEAFKLTAAASDGGPAGIGGTLSTALRFVLYIIMFLVAVVVIAAMIIVLVARIVVLWILVTLSPVAFVADVLSFTQKYAKQWWSNFVKYVFIGPIFAFFLWFSFLFVGAGMTPGTDALNSDVIANSGSTYSDPVVANAPSVWQMVDFVVAIALLIIGLNMAQKLGIAGSKLAMSLAKGAQGVAKRWAGRGGKLGKITGAHYIGQGVDWASGKVTGKKISERWSGLKAKATENLKTEKGKKGIKGLGRMLLTNADLGDKETRAELGKGQGAGVKALLSMVGRGRSVKGGVGVAYATAMRHIPGEYRKAAWAKHSEEVNRETREEAINELHKKYRQFGDLGRIGKTAFGPGHRERARQKFEEAQASHVKAQAAQTGKIGEDGPEVAKLKLEVITEQANNEFERDAGHIQLEIDDVDEEMKGLNAKLARDGALNPKDRERFLELQAQREVLLNSTTYKDADEKRKRKISDFTEKIEILKNGLNPGEESPYTAEELAETEQEVNDELEKIEQSTLRDKDRYAILKEGASEKNLEKLQLMDAQDIAQRRNGMENANRGRLENMDKYSEQLLKAQIHAGAEGINLEMQDDGTLKQVNEAGEEVDKTEISEDTSAILAEISKSVEGIKSNESRLAILDIDREHLNGVEKVQEGFGIKREEDGKIDDRVIEKVSGEEAIKERRSTVKTNMSEVKKKEDKEEGSVADILEAQSLADRVEVEHENIESLTDKRNRTKEALEAKKTSAKKHAEKTIDEKAIAKITDDIILEIKKLEKQIGIAEKTEKAFIGDDAELIKLNGDLETAILGEAKDKIKNEIEARKEKLKTEHQTATAAKEENVKEVKNSQELLVGGKKEDETDDAYNARVRSLMDGNAEAKTSAVERMKEKAIDEEALKATIGLGDKKKELEEMEKLIRAYSRFRGYRFDNADPSNWQVDRTKSQRQQADADGNLVMDAAGKPVYEAWDPENLTGLDKHFKVNVLFDYKLDKDKDKEEVERLRQKAIEKLNKTADILNGDLDKKLELIGEAQKAFSGPLNLQARRAKKMELDAVEKEMKTQKKKMLEWRTDAEYYTRRHEQEQINKELAKLQDIENSDELIQEFYLAEEKKDKFRGMAIIKKLANDGNFNDILDDLKLNTNISGMAKFFDEHLIKNMKVNRQSSYALENDISLILERMKHFTMSRTIRVENGKFKRANQKEQLHAVLAQALKMPAGDIIRNGTRLAYGYNDPNTGKFVLQPIGAALLEMLGPQMARARFRGDLNPNAEVNFYQEIENIVKQVPSLKKMTGTGGEQPLYHLFRTTPPAGGSSVSEMVAKQERLFRELFIDPRTGKTIVEAIEDLTPGMRV